MPTVHQCLQDSVSNDQFLYGLDVVFSVPRPYTVCHVCGMLDVQVVIPAWYSGDVAQEGMHTASESSQLVPALHVDDSCTCQLHVPKGTCRLFRRQCWHFLMAKAILYARILCFKSLTRLLGCIVDFYDAHVSRVLSMRLSLFRTHHHYITLSRHHMHLLKRHLLCHLHKRSVKLSRLNMLPISSLQHMCASHRKSATDAYEKACQLQ